MLDATLILHPQVALRPEPFGALAYHYGNRKLIFLKHPDMVRVVRALGDHDSLADTLRAYCREQLAGFKVPRSIDFLDELPTTGTGKVQIYAENMYESDMFNEKPLGTLAIFGRSLIRDATGFSLYS